MADYGIKRNPKPKTAGTPMKVESATGAVARMSRVEDLALNALANARKGQRVVKVKLDEL